jgi:hypothetical protein
MKTPFNIAIVEHPEFRHVAVFHDLARLLSASLQTLGHAVTVQTNRTEGNAVNIVLGYQWGQAAPGAYWIPFQLEQLSDQNDRLYPQWIQVLRAAPEIWDYDPANIAYLKSQGIENVKHVPLGFHPALRTIPKVPEDIDVLHYGSLTERRRDIIDALRAHCRVEAIFGFYGQKRDSFIARSKIVLNAHLYDSNIFEQARVSYLLNNGKCVVSEESPYNPYDGMVVTAPYGRLVERCLELLSDEDKRRRIAEEGEKRFHSMPMTETLSRVIQNRHFKEGDR